MRIDRVHLQKNKNDLEKKNEFFFFSSSDKQEHASVKKTNP